MKCTLYDKDKGVAKFTVGNPPPTYTRLHEYVVMLVGATGAGKTTLINGIVNYILGVAWKDPFRFKIIVDENPEVCEAYSQTKFITAYTIYKQDGSPFPHTLTIIDTPGFGDTEGIDRDDILKGQIRDFFQVRGANGIDSIHAIGFVTQASMVRLTPTQKYIFDSILSIFGKNIGSNIMLMVTFADHRRPPVLDAVKAAEIPFCHYFKFNNSALFAEQQDADAAKETAGSLEATYWKIGMDSFEGFCNHLVTAQARSLTLTKEVLDERQQLEIVMQGLQEQLKRMVGKLDELKQEKHAMQENEVKIAANENFTYRVTTYKEIKHDISGTGRNVTNCLKCNFTCHKRCAYANNADKIKCKAMKDGLCTACPKQCQWDLHVNNPWWFEVVEVPEERTYHELKKRYDEASAEVTRVQTMVDKIESEITEMRVKALEKIDKAQKTLERLDEIALRPNPLSQVDYIDLLIQSEKNEAKEGFLKRIDCLNDLKQKATLLASVPEMHLHEGLQKAGEIASRRATSK